MAVIEGKKWGKYLISLNFSSASGDGFLSGWYCWAEALMGGMCRSERSTNLHGGLSIALFEGDVIGIDADA
jgi:hypothetical protein